MAIYENRLIISQRYVQTTDSSTASLINLCGNDAWIERENGAIQKVSIDSFKRHFKLLLPL